MHKNEKTYIPYVVFVIFIVTLFIFNIYRNNIKHESSTLNDYNYNKNKTENPNTTEDFENFYYMVKEKNNIFRNIGTAIDNVVSIWS